MQYIEIKPELVPYEFVIELGGEDYTFDIRHNEQHDFYTIDLYKNGELVEAGEKLVYGQVLWSRTYDPRTHPPQTLMPYDKAGYENTVTRANLNKTVFLFVVGEDE